MKLVNFLFFILLVSFNSIVNAQEVECNLIPMEFSNDSFKKAYCSRNLNAQSTTYEAWFDSDIAYLFLSHTNIRNPDWAFTGADFSKSLEREYIQDSLNHWSEFLNPGNITFFDKDKVHRSDDKKKFYYRLFKTENLSGLRFTATFNNKNDLHGYFFLLNNQGISEQSAVSIIDAIFVKRMRTKTKQMKNSILENNDSIEETVSDLNQNSSNSNKVNDTSEVSTEDLESFTEYCESTPFGEIDEKLVPLCLKIISKSK